MGDIVQKNEGEIKHQLGEMVRQSVEKTLNALLDAETDQIHRRTGMNAQKAVWIRVWAIIHGSW